MKLSRVLIGNRVVPCANIKDSTILDVSSKVSDWSEDFLNPSFLSKLEREIEENSDQFREVKNLSSHRVLPPFTPSQILSIGLNYSDHCHEAGMEQPSEPIIASKSHLSIAGAYDDIILPPRSSKVDWEVELGIVIGRRTQYLSSPEEASAHIAGFCTANDLSERDWLLNRNGQWIKGKSCESFSPVGPYLVTKDSVPDPNSLDLFCRVNGEVKQNSNSRNMIFTVDFLVYYVSQFMILQPGDLIMSGSPGGMALGTSNPRYLQHGDIVETEIAGLGSQLQRCRNYEPYRN